MMLNKMFIQLFWFDVPTRSLFKYLFLNYKQLKLILMPILDFLNIFSPTNLPKGDPCFRSIIGSC